MTENNFIKSRIVVEITKSPKDTADGDSIVSSSPEMCPKDEKTDFPLWIFLNGSTQERLRQKKFLLEIMEGKRGKYAANIMVAAKEAGMLDDIPWREVNVSFPGGVGKRDYYNHAKKSYLSDATKRLGCFEPVKKKIEKLLDELGLKPSQSHLS